jgi:hypothetical protein
LLERMASEGVPPNVPAYSAAISACDKAPVPQARAALGLLERMRRDGLRPDVILYSAVMSACGKAGLWEAAEQVLLPPCRPPRSPMVGAQVAVGGRAVPAPWSGDGAGGLGVGEREVGTLGLGMAAGMG